MVSGYVRAPLSAAIIAPSPQANDLIHLIVEVPITYTGRTYADGKKIRFRDFLSAVWTLIRLRVGS